jgi:hypothetical protein
VSKTVRQSAEWGDWIVGMLSSVLAAAAHMRTCSTACLQSASCAPSGMWCALHNSVRPSARRMMEDAGSTVCTYARIATVEMQIPTDLLDFWQEPASFFIMSGAL